MLARFGPEPTSLGWDFDRWMAGIRQTQPEVDTFGAISTDGFLISPPVWADLARCSDALSECPLGLPPPPPRVHPKVMLGEPRPQFPAQPPAFFMASQQQQPQVMFMQHMPMMPSALPQQQFGACGGQWSS